MNKPKRTKRNATSISAKLIVWMFVLSAAALSAHDIVTLFERIGAAAPLSFLAPVFIDGITWLGKLMRSHSLSKRTNATGLVYLVIGGGASLAANLTAGETLGMKLLGLLAVTGFILGEIALDKIEPRAQEASAEVDEQTKAKRSAAARKAAATRKANKARAGRKPRSAKIATTVAELDAVYAADSAPVSPAPTSN
jgi:hypothetical protein